MLVSNLFIPSIRAWHPTNTNGHGILYQK